MLAQWRQTTLMVSSNATLSISGNDSADMLHTQYLKHECDKTKQKNQNREISTQLSYNLSTQNDVAFSEKKKKTRGQQTRSTLRQPSHIKPRAHTYQHSENIWDEVSCRGIRTSKIHLLWCFDSDIDRANNTFAFVKGRIQVTSIFCRARNSSISFILS